MLGGGGGWDWRLKIRTLVLVSSFAYVHISTTTHLKPFIFGPWIPLRVCFHSMNPGLMVHAGGGTRGKKIGHCSKCYSTFLL